MLGRLLAKDPEARYRRAREALEDVCRQGGACLPLPVETSKLRGSFLRAPSFVGPERDLALLSDALGVGLPVYIYRPPFNAWEYLKGLPELAGLPAFVFPVHGTVQGYASTAMRKTLAKKGAREVGFFHTRGANYFLEYLKQGYLLSLGHPASEELAAEEAFGGEVAARLGARPTPRQRWRGARVSSILWNGC